MQTEIFYRTSMKTTGERREVRIFFPEIKVHNLFKSNNTIEFFKIYF